MALSFDTFFLRLLDYFIEKYDKQELQMYYNDSDRLDIALGLMQSYAKGRARAGLNLEAATSLDNLIEQRNAKLKIYQREQDRIELTTGLTTPSLIDAPNLPTIESMDELELSRFYDFLRKFADEVNTKMMYPIIGKLDDDRLIAEMYPQIAMAWIIPNLLQQTLRDKLTEEVIERYFERESDLMPEQETAEIVREFYEINGFKVGYLGMYVSKSNEPVAYILLQKEDDYFNIADMINGKLVPPEPMVIFDRKFTREELEFFECLPMKDGTSGIRIVYDFDNVAGKAYREYKKQKQELVLNPKFSIKAPIRTHMPLYTVVDIIGARR